MRFIVPLLFTISCSFAQDGLSLKEVMQLINQSAVKVLEGFLLGNDRMIIEGAREIADHPKPAGGPLRYIRPSKRDEFRRRVKDFEKQIHGGALRIIELVKENRKKEAMKQYFRVIRGCVACHRAFRDGS